MFRYFSLQQFHSSSTFFVNRDLYKNQIDSPTSAFSIEIQRLHHFYDIEVQYSMKTLFLMSLNQAKRRVNLWNSCIFSKIYLLFHRSVQCSQFEQRRKQTVMPCSWWKCQRLAIKTKFCENPTAL